MIPFLNCARRFLRIASLSLSRVLHYLAALIVRLGSRVSKRTPRLFQKIVAIIIFFAESLTLIIFATDEEGCFLVIESRFVSCKGVMVQPNLTTCYYVVKKSNIIPFKVTSSINFMPARPGNAFASPQKIPADVQYLFCDCLSVILVPISQ